MSRVDPLLWVQDMLSHAEEASALAVGLTRESLESDRLRQLALVRLLEIVGEAASQVTADLRARHPQIPWTGITRFRNRMTHGYHAIDLDIVWAVANDDLPPLITQLQEVIRQETSASEPGSG
jgi:uncharacterized protein with HEPN domain